MGQEYAGWQIEVEAAEGCLFAGWTSEDIEAVDREKSKDRFNSRQLSRLEEAYPGATVTLLEDGKSGIVMTSPDPGDQARRDEEREGLFAQQVVMDAYEDAEEWTVAKQ